MQNYLPEEINRVKAILDRRFSGGYKVFRLCMLMKPNNFKPTRTFEEKYSDQLRLKFLTGRREMFLRIQDNKRL